MNTNIPKIVEAIGALKKLGTEKEETIKEGVDLVSIVKKLSERSRKTKK